MTSVKGLKYARAGNNISVSPKAEGLMIKIFNFGPIFPTVLSFALSLTIQGD
jgi:hypothetical protein